ncbi:hypothetical protein GPECTOR_114g318 [Gonium pectorale]|uniref:Uncharacterized protein n=1 Tax=Gonium pectorale TaxID=33097 RepID=A0A150FZ59_GONPE|nr:hypothetical protein GPECTOR_114g318 [Gonium pectorale]|eukprot:KXZ42867.1 hypothetical protein GPECTOR_114g318 [Gonium pectorale]
MMSTLWAMLFGNKEYKIVMSELFNLLESDELAKTPILVYANKQDLRDAMSVEELTGALMLHSIRNHDWHIQACCALTGEGLLDGINWVYQRTKGNAS